MSLRVEPLEVRSRQPERPKVAYLGATAAEALKTRQDSEGTEVTYVGIIAVEFLELTLRPTSGPRSLTDVLEHSSTSREVSVASGPRSRTQTGRAV